MKSPLENETLAAPGPAMATNTPVAAEIPPPLPQIAAGELPAALVPPLDEALMNDPTIAGILSNFGELGKLGIEYYEAADQSTVLYNPKLITDQQLAEAEQNGTLPQIAPPVTELSQSPEAVGSPMPLAGASMTSTGQPETEARLATARARNINDGPRVSPIQPNPITQQLGKRPF